jgi:hypothetical protein
MAFDVSELDLKFTLDSGLLIVALLAVNLNYCCLLAPRSRLYIIIFLCTADTFLTSEQMQIMVLEYEAVWCLRTGGNLFFVFARDANKKQICGERFVI